MANGDPFARMVKMMERQGANLNGYDMSIAKVVSVDPLQIIDKGNLIERNLICNGLITSDKNEELEAILSREEGISQELKQFLKDLYKELRAEAGDEVLVQRVNNSYYICGKVAGQ
ncbi:MAG: hypothetical protein OSJ71_17225 [Acetatifactor sp.]|nr:hypothetical protein [Acetatifactor sp.]